MSIPLARRRTQSSGPPSGRGAWTAIRPTALLGFSPFAGLIPRWVSRCLHRSGPACLSRIAHRDLFSSRNRPSGGKSKCEKGRAIMSVSFGFQASLPSSVQPTRISRVGRSCLGLCLSQDCGSRPAGHSDGLDPARIISLRKPLPAPIRSWVLATLLKRDEIDRSVLREAVSGLIPAVAPIPSAYFESASQASRL